MACSGAHGQVCIEVFCPGKRKLKKSTDIDLYIQYISVSGIFSIFDFVTVLKYERCEFLDSFIHFLVSLACSFSAIS